jgi:hypothetical protein
MASRPPIYQQFRQTQFREITSPPSPSYSVDQSQGKCTRRVRVPWDNFNQNLPQMFIDYLGYSEGIGKAGPQGLPQQISRILPIAHPNFPNYLFAESLQSVEGDVPGDTPNQDAAGGSVGFYEEAVVQVVYSSRDYEFVPDATVFAVPAGEAQLTRYVTISVKTTAKYENLPAPSALLWAIAPQEALINKAAVILCEADVQIIWRQIPLNCVPLAAINATIGCCNDNPLGLPSNPYAPFLGVVGFPVAGNGNQAAAFGPNYDGKLVCLAPEFSKQYKMANGLPALDITYRFKSYPFGANFFFRWQTGRMEPTYIPLPPPNVAGLTGQIYKRANFNLLFWGI